MLEKINRLREIMDMMKVDLFLLPMRDEFGSEYVPEHFRRIEFLTGFKGSNAFLVIGIEKCAFFTDGRYTLQAKLELEEGVFEIFDMSEKSYDTWLNENFEKGMVAFDPALFTEKTVEDLRNKLQKFELFELKENLIDLIWEDRPEYPASKAFILDEKYCGESAKSKLGRLAEKIEGSYLLITDPENICWLANIRARDIEHTPVMLCYALVSQNGSMRIYTNYREGLDKISKIEGIKSVREIEKLYEDIENLGAAKIDSITFQAVRNKDNKKILDFIRKSGGDIVFKEDEILNMRANKNEIEQKNIEQAHVKDGVAVCKFLCELDKILENETEFDEDDVSVYLEKYRAETQTFLHPSFATIAGFNENAAIIHYRAKKETCKKIEKNGVLLIDSGGQYLEGTTDITRTIFTRNLATGNVDNEIKRNFTLVLKGHIAVASAKFPKGSNGAQLDGLARAALWKDGKDFKHGTGHGVGFCLNVHEGPHGISKINSVALKAGMVVSNEPGYYAEGEYGIRIESLVLVEECNKVAGFLQFKTLTQVPIDLNLIDENLLNEEEKIWLNAYHEGVFECIEKFLSEDEKNWLRNKTRKI